MLENTVGAIKNGQSRETGNTGHTRQTKTKQNTTQYDNPEKLATQGTQDKQKTKQNTTQYDNPEKLATQGTQDKQKTKHNTICVGHRYAETNTNNVNKT